MDEEIKSLLAEIAGQLKERNQMMRDSQTASEEMRSKLLGRAEGDDTFLNLKKVREESEQQLARMEEDSKRSQEEARKARDEKNEFQQAFLVELRRLNANLERLSSLKEG